MKTLEGYEGYKDMHHTFGVRVYYEDTDAAGIVYHANYLRFAERARTEFLGDLGFDHKMLREEEQMFFAVRSLSMDFFKPGKLDDRLLVRTACIKVGGSSFQSVQRIERDEELLTEIKLQLVCVDEISKKAKRMPQKIRQAFLEAIVEDAV